jgi:hypothetical protein
MEEDEDDFDDSKSHLTKHLTGSQYDMIRERSEVNSAEELRYGHFYSFCGKLFHFRGFKDAVDTYFEYKVSKDRASRTEDVSVLQGMYEDDRSHATGTRLAQLEEEMSKQQKGKKIKGAP